MEMSEESDIQKVMGFSGFGGRKCCMKGYMDHCILMYISVVSRVRVLLDSQHFACMPSSQICVGYQPLHPD